MRGNRYAKSHSDALPDFVELAESFGIKELRAEHPDAVDSLIAEMLAHPDAVDSLIAEMLAHPGPVLADVRGEKGEYMFPMIPAGAAHNEMRLSAEDGAVHADEGMLLA